MTEKFSRFDIAEFLLTPADMWNYLQASEEEDSGDGRFIRLAFRDVKHTIRARIHSDPQFAQAFRIEVATLFHNGEPEIAQRMLRLLTQSLRHHTARGLFTYRH
jgi:DNA-binding phage protein